MDFRRKSDLYLAFALPLAHLVLFFIANTPIAVTLPALAICIYAVVGTLRNEQQRRIMTQKSARPFRGLAVFSVLTFAAFYFGGDDISFKLQMARAFLTDVTAGILGVIIAVHLHRRRMPAG